MSTCAKENRGVAKTIWIHSLEATNVHIKRLLWYYTNIWRKIEYLSYFEGPWHPLRKSLMYSQPPSLPLTSIFTFYCRKHCLGVFWVPLAAGSSYTQHKYKVSWSKICPMHTDGWFDSNFVNICKSVLVSTILCQDNPSTWQVWCVEMLIQLHACCTGVS